MLEVARNLKVLHQATQTMDGSFPGSQVFLSKLFSKYV